VNGVTYVVFCNPVMGTPYEVSTHDHLELAIKAADMFTVARRKEHYVEKREVVWVSQ
jgi:hypothetical protein